MIRAVFTLVFLSLFLTACDNDAKKFPGFKPVEVPGQDVVYLYEEASLDKRSAAYHEGVFSAFTLLKKVQDGYIIQEASTDCSEHLNTKDGYFYAYKDNIRKEYPGSGKPFEIGNDLHLKMLLKEVCVQKDRDLPQTIASQYDIVHIIPHNNGSQGFLTKDTQAKKSLKNAHGAVAIKNGSEVVIHGASNDGKWIEIEYKAYKKLYVPVENVATFSD